MHPKNALESTKDSTEKTLTGNKNVGVICP